MTAIASLGGVTGSGAATAAAPMVFVASVAEPRLSVMSLRMNSPLDERHVRLLALEAVDKSALASRWLGREAVVVMPHRLSDETVRGSVLARGVLERFERTGAEGVEQHRFVLHDAWSRRLARPVETVWWADRASGLRPLAQGALVPGPEGNRSHEMYEIAGARVHVLEEGGQPWTVGTAVAMLDALGGLRLSLSLVPGELRAAPLVSAVDLGRPVGEGLARVLEPYGLTVRRELWRDGHTVVEQRHVRALGQGRPVRLRWGELERPLADALRIDHAAPADAAQRWVAQASGWRIESTFELVGGWDPALEGEDDEAYDRAASDDFARYANVYRHWVLNEDGRFSAAPYERGEPFDLAAFFGDSRVRAQPLRFEACVTLDDAGAPRRPVVEVSTDDGATWSQYGGKAVVSERRAAVYLDDDTLPTAFLAAAKQGEAKVRVTATLHNPQPVQWTRWRGNAFAGERPARVLAVGQAFGFRRVDETSIHHEAVRDGTLLAREVDDRQALDAWLVERMREADRRMGAMLEGRGRVDLAGAWPWLRIGDRLIEAGGPGRGATGEPEAVARRGVALHALEVHFGVTAHTGPRTVAHVRFA